MHRNPPSTIRHQKCLHGFTLVELLVVITIIGILISLLLPAVQAAREAARRMQCCNNLKQLGLAVLNYENARQIFPPGAFYADAVSPGGYCLATDPMKGSIFVHLLPFIEQQAMYDAYDFKQVNILGQKFPGTTTEIRSSVISCYVCPSDGHPATFEIPADGGWWIGDGRTVALHNYSASAGPNTVANNSSCSCALDFGKEINGPPLTFTGYALGSYYMPGKTAGPFDRMGQCKTVADIRDGLSNTIFFGEIQPLSSGHAQRGWEDSCNGSGFVSTIIPINFDTSIRDSSGDPCNRYINWNTELGFKSAHPGGANFAFGDGSVHHIPQSIDHQMYQYLGGRADGHPVTVDF